MSNLARPKLVVDDPFGPLPKRREGVRVFRFIKCMNPGEKVQEFENLGVKFHLPVGHDGKAAPMSSFETEDIELADEIRRVAKARPTLYISESA